MIDQKGIDSQNFPSKTQKSQNKNFNIDQSTKSLAWHKQDTGKKQQQAQEDKKRNNTNSIGVKYSAIIQNLLVLLTSKAILYYENPRNNPAASLEKEFGARFGQIRKQGNENLKYA